MFVGLSIWPQQELTLRAAARQQVEVTGQDVGRARHAAVVLSTRRRALARRGDDDAAVADAWYA